MGTTVLKEYIKTIRNRGNSKRDRIHASEFCSQFCTPREDIILLQNIIHDLRMPLTLIYMDSKELKKQEECKQDELKRIERIKKNCYRMTKLVNDACDSGRIASGNFRTEYVSCDVAALIKGTIDSVRPFAEYKNVSLIYESDIEEKIIDVDCGLLERILLNLLSNAFKYTGEGGTIKVALKDLRETIGISVSDEGGGFALEALKHCFDRYLTEYSENNARGSGIGLSIVRQLVDIMGGQISVRNLKRGAEVRLRLPTTAAEDTEPSTKSRIVNDFYLDNLVDIEMSEL